MRSARSRETRRSAVRVGGAERRSIWLADDGVTVEIIDQTRLPFEFVVARLAHLADAVEAIRTMQVRGAPLIGVTAAYGLCLALRADASDAALDVALANAGRLQNEWWRATPAWRRAAILRETAAQIRERHAELSALIDSGIPAVTLGISHGKRMNKLDEEVAISSISTGVAQLISVLLAIDGGYCDER